MVGIGASAGGVEALREFFAAMPVDSGIPFLVAMHLPPRGESLLPEVLSSVTSMDTVLAYDGLAISPDTVYLLPGDPELVVGNGQVQLRSPAKSSASPANIIDRLFTALSRDFAHGVVAIILSGTGRDGTSGATAVKRAGGFVMAQTPASALFPDMPASAIATKDVHMVLPVRQMPDKIMEVRQLLRGCAPSTEYVLACDTELGQILSLVKARTGHDFGSYKSETVLRRVQRRMALHGVPDLADYLSFLENNPHEPDALRKDILIGVTSFFRDPDAFAALNERVIPQLFVKAEPDHPVRVWVPCCATGEEVYSLAILIREHLEARRLSAKVQLFATDLDDGAIARARSGIFPLSIAQEMSAERLQTWFSRVDNHYVVAKSLREMIVFAHHSLIKDPPFSRLDLLVCRNFLIYLNKEMQHQLISLFHQVLKPKSFFGCRGNGGAPLGALHAAWRKSGRSSSVRGASPAAIWPWPSPRR